jgi:hypothetical protein
MLKYLTIAAVIIVSFSILSVVGSLPSVQSYFDKISNPTSTPTPSHFNPYIPNSTYGALP